MCVVINIGVQVVGRDMIRRQCHGAIVNVSSILSQCAKENEVAYCASKGALDQVTRSMAVALGPRQVPLIIIRSFVS